MAFSKIRNFSSPISRKDYMNEIIIHVFITHVFRVVVLMINDIRAFETENTVSLQLTTDPI